MWRGSDVYKDRKLVVKTSILLRHMRNALLSAPTFTSLSLAAQLSQVPNYGGNARAKPGMYIKYTHSRT